MKISKRQSFKTNSFQLKMYKISCSSLGSMLAVAILLATFEAAISQQRSAYPQESHQQSLNPRRHQAKQSQNFAEPPQETLHGRHNKMGSYQQSVYNNNPRQIPYQGNNQHNGNNLQNGNGRGAQCQRKIWIPVDVVDKYPLAGKGKIDEQNSLRLIETCCDGYSISMRWHGNAICRPVCENCQNGFCRAPNECECFEGFVKNDNDDCVFKCPLGCLNGRCYLDGTCKCDPGYKLDKTRQYCQPICSNGCGENERHNCTEPEVCGCAKGYQLSDEGCQPVCDPSCGIGGICRDANTCECSPEYQLKDGVCQADCYQKCENGICYARNRCICKPGYRYHERSTYCVLA